MTEVKYTVFASVPTKIEVEALNEEDAKKKVYDSTVKEFAQKIKDGVADYLYKTNFDGHKDNIVDIFELCEIVDNTVKEYEE